MGLGHIWGPNPVRRPALYVLSSLGRAYLENRLKFGALSHTRVMNLSGVNLRCSKPTSLYIVDRFVDRLSQIAFFVDPLL